MTRVPVTLQHGAMFAFLRGSDKSNCKDIDTLKTWAENMFSKKNTHTFVFNTFTVRFKLGRL